MSEAEKRRRQAYRQGRKKWIQIELLVLAGLLLFAAIFSILYRVFNRATYIPYMEQSEVDYRVLLKENDFYDEPYAEEGKAYVTALIDRVETDFAYEMLMGSDNVSFEYAYRVDAVLQITDKLVTENKLTTLMITHNMHDAIAYGNRLIMMHEGRILVDVSGEEKKKLTINQLLQLFEQASGSTFANDKVILSK
jgi:hypothetical protein